jgi:hypothetical protein
MSSFTTAEQLKKSRLADPTQCKGFSSAAGTRLVIIPVLGYSSKRALSLVDRATVAWPLPLEVEAVPETLEGSVASLVERPSLADEASEEITDNGTERRSFFSREDADFAEQVGVNSQCHLGFHWSSASVGLSDDSSFSGGGNCGS